MVRVTAGKITVNENLIFVHILHRNTSKIFPIIMYVMLKKKVMHSRVMCLDT